MGFIRTQSVSPPPAVNVLERVFSFNLIVLRALVNPPVCDPSMADSLLFQKHLCPEPGGGRGLLVPHDRTDFHWFIDSSHKYLLSLLFNYEDEPERRMFASRPPNKEIPLNEMASRHLD